MGAKTRVQRLTDKIVEQSNGKKKKRVRARKKALSKRRLNKTGKTPIGRLRPEDGKELPPFAFTYCTTKRGRVVRVGVGSVYVEMEEEDERGTRKYVRHHISRMTTVYPLK